MCCTKTVILYILFHFVVANLSSSILCQEQEDLASISPMHEVAMNLAAECRYTKYTKLSLPFQAQEVRLLGLNKDQFIFSYIPSKSDEKTVHIQALMTHNLDSVLFYDATFLCTGESAEEFYSGNYEYLIALDEIDYFQSLPPGMVIETVPSKLVYPDGDEIPIDIYHSHGRALIHVCGWIDYLAFYEKDLHRALEFLTFILQKQQDILLELLSDKDFKSLEEGMYFFDDCFPYLIFEEPLPLNAAQREICKTFFETTLYVRNRLEALKPMGSPYIMQDSAILKILSVD